jgi:hypothetical protein
LRSTNCYGEFDSITKSHSSKRSDPENVPDNPDECLEAFNTFSIYEVLPQLIELWGLNVETQAESKKNIAKLTAR